MYSCPDCGEELSSELDKSGTAYRHYCHNPTCLVIEVKSGWNHKFREIKREAVARPIPLKGLTYEEITRNIMMESNDIE